MTRKINISVILSVYNTEFPFVKRAIDSVLNQDFQNFELIVIDDGSTNQTQNQLLSYCIQHQQKIIYIRHANCGQSESINRGVLNCVGEFITILDGDDEFKPNHLSVCLGEMETADLIASTTETIVDKVADYYVPDRHDNSRVIHVDECILFATLFGKREVFTTLKFKNMYAADADYYERASKQFVVKKVDLRTYIYYRNMPNSTVSQLKRANK